MAGVYLINYLAYLDRYPVSTQLEEPFRVTMKADAAQLDGLDTVAVAPPEWLYFLEDQTIYVGDNL